MHAPRSQTMTEIRQSPPALPCGRRRIHGLLLAAALAAIGCWIGCSLLDFASGLGESWSRFLERLVQYVVTGLDLETWRFFS